MFLRFLTKTPLRYATLGIADLWLLWDKNNQALWDKVVNTVVVDDKEGRLVPAAA
jgi:hypothetical protein